MYAASIFALLGCHVTNKHLQFYVSVAIPAEPRGEKKTFFCANFGR